MKKHARILALLLAVCMITAIFAACSNNDDPKQTSATTPKAGDTTTPDTKPDVTTPAPLDVSGYTFRIMGSNDVFPKTNEDGSYVNQNAQELAEKLEDLEEKLGITIEKLDGGSLEQVTTAALSGDLLADIIWMHQQGYWPAAKQNALLPLDDEKLVNAGLNYADETRWYQPAVKWTALFGKTWGLNVASKYVAAPTGYFVTFNKDICASAGYNDLYQLVRDKKWTWDVYREIARKATKDTNSDGVPDIWGTGATAWGNEAISNGVQFVGEVNGKWQMTIDSDAGIRALQFLYDMNYGDKTRLDESSGKCREAFANGTIAFNWSTMGHIDGPTSSIFGANHDYGIIPMPMGPDATEYYSMTDNNRAFVIQAAHKDLDKAVAILNEWALIVNDTESYLDILDDGRCRTEEDKQMMIDYIFPTYTLNMGKMNDDVWGIVDENDDRGIISDVSYGGHTPKQAIEEWGDALNAALDKFFDQK